MLVIHVATTQPAVLDISALINRRLVEEQKGIMVNVSKASRSAMRLIIAHPVLPVLIIFAFQPEEEEEEHVRV